MAHAMSQKAPSTVTATMTPAKRPSRSSSTRTARRARATDPVRARAATTAAPDTDLPTSALEVDADVDGALPEVALAGADDAAADGELDLLAAALAGAADDAEVAIDDAAVAEAPEADADADADEEPAEEVAANDPRAQRRHRDGSTYLSMYFRDMAALDVLRPEEEFTAAREIETLDIMLWSQILAFPPVVDRVLGVVEACLDNALVDFRGMRKAAADAGKSSAPAQSARYAATAQKCAEKLRAIDTDRLYLEAVLAELDRVGQGVPGRGGKLGFSTSSRAYTEYVRRVAAAARASADARNDFVKANLRLVVSIARRFNHGRMALADLIQEGNLGLIKAVERYDYRRGFRFSTYASWWIRHAISRALADKGREVRLPVHMIDAHHRLSKAKRELTARLGRQPTTEDLAEATGIAADKIEKMRTYLLDQSVSIDRPSSDEEGRQVVEYLQDPYAEESSPTDDLASEALTGELHRLLSELKPIEADILRRRFGLADDKELTLKEIGEQYNLSRERIRQLQEQALMKMRRALERKELI
jgi:RNA polymerase sigma factor (sigma-70 family)